MNMNHREQGKWLVNTWLFSGAETDTKYLEKHKGVRSSDIGGEKQLPTVTELAAQSLH
jgi:hypothetical protein